MRRRIVENLQQFIVLVKFVLSKVGNQHFTWTEPPAMHYFLRIEINQTGLGADDDQIIFRHEESARPKAIAIERGTDKTPIRKGERCRPVPWLNAVFVIGKKGRVAFVLRGRQKQAYGFGDGSSIVCKQFQNFVQACRIRPMRGKNWLQLI